MRDSFPLESPLCKELSVYLGEIWKGKKNEWNLFWKGILSEIQNDSNFKLFFVVLCLLRNFLKKNVFQASDIKHVLVEELIHLWLNNFNVKN